jgi:hypothetical protein
MFDASSRRKTTKRFTLLLLEEEEDYVADYVGTCRSVRLAAASGQGGAILCSGSVAVVNSERRCSMVQPRDCFGVTPVQE